MVDHEPFDNGLRFSTCGPKHAVVQHCVLSSGNMGFEPQPGAKLKEYETIYGAYAVVDEVEIKKMIR